MSNFTAERQWFDGARFGMFIHFGLYTLRRMNENSYHSWTFRKYAALMKKFNPRNLDADSWARLAKDAGCSYAVLTTKHGEGFCLWHTQLSRYHAGNTPLGNDIVKRYADAMRRAGLRVGLYYAMDNWFAEHDPGDVWRRRGLTYAQFVLGQIRELMSGYGRIDLVWFDGYHPTVSRKDMLRITHAIRSMQPSCVINDRGLPHDDSWRNTGDFITPERFIPVDIAGKPQHIECCDAMSIDSWGYKPDSPQWSATEMVKRLARSASIGANYLLNVEPMPDGRIRPGCVDRMRAIGAWMHLNRVSIYGTVRCPLFPRDPFAAGSPSIGVCTLGKNALYLHIFQWPSASRILIQGVRPHSGKARILGTHLAIDIAATPNGMIIDNLPLAPPGVFPAVIAVEIRGRLSIDTEAFRSQRRAVVTALPGRTIYLRPIDARLAGRDGIAWHRIGRSPDGAVTTIGNLTHGGLTTSWHVAVRRTATYRVYAEIGSNDADPGDAHLIVSVNGVKLKAGLPRTGSYYSPWQIMPGKVRLRKGMQQIVVTFAQKPFNYFFDIHGLVLQPINDT